jgi:hypothetical protein
MTSTDNHAITPLRQRMIDDMRMRKLSPKTQAHYIRIVRQFAGFLGRSPDTECRRATALSIVSGRSWPVVNVTEYDHYRAEVFL